MTADESLRQPTNPFERLLWLHGRKFYLAFFAGSSQFLVTILAIVAIWVVAGTDAPPEMVGRLIVEIVRDYLFSSAGIVLTYTGGNTLVERAHAQRPPEPRPSGAVTGVGDG